MFSTGWHRLVNTNHCEIQQYRKCNCRNCLFTICQGEQNYFQIRWSSRNESSYFISHRHFRFFNRYNSQYIHPVNKARYSIETIFSTKNKESSVRTIYLYYQLHIDFFSSLLARLSACFRRENNKNLLKIGVLVQNGKFKMLLLKIYLFTNMNLRYGY